MSNKPLFRIKQIINENYIPNLKMEVKKKPQTSSRVGTMKKIKEENHQLQVENNTINSAYIAVKNSLTFL